MARYIKDVFTNEYKWVEDKPPIRIPKKAVNSGPMIIRDIEPYQSAIDGTVISGRRQHRDHLRAHECVEVGTEKIRARAPDPLPPVERDIKEAMEKVAAGHRPRPIGSYREN